MHSPIVIVLDGTERYHGNHDSGNHGNCICITGWYGVVQPRTRINPLLLLTVIYTRPII